MPNYVSKSINFSCAYFVQDEEIVSLKKRCSNKKSFLYSSMAPGGHRLSPKEIFFRLTRENGSFLMECPKNISC